MGKLKWVLCGFCMLLSLGAIGASEKYIGEGRWGNGSNRDSALFVVSVSDFPGNPESSEEEKCQGNCLLV
mgnify:CR=1 FL=1